MQENKKCRNVAVLTCVTNNGKVGPGHTAIVIDKMVYTFETINMDAKKSGWRILPSRKYLAENIHRPVVVQELSKSVDASGVYGFIYQDDKADSDYGSSGLCSQRAAMAISAGAPINIDPIGLNTPFQVYRFLEQNRLVANAYNTGNGGMLASTLMRMNYITASARTRAVPPILRW